ncbi:hypothetical protein J3R74_000284 [Puniceicoccus vermicola]
MALAIPLHHDDEKGKLHNGSNVGRMLQHLPPLSN